MSLSRPRAWGGAFAFACLTLGGTGSAHAFDYPEHARISYAGIHLFLDGEITVSDEPPAARGESMQDCTQEPARSQNKRCFLQTLRDGLESTRACPAERFLTYASPGCFTASDLPALAGDHAGTPLFLKWKWFNDFAKPQDVDSTFQVALRTVWGLSKQTSPPGEVRAGVGDWSGFIRYLRRYDSRTWGAAQVCREGSWDPLDPRASLLHACPADDMHPNDFELTRYDSDYVSLGERGHAHFRPGICGPHTFTPARRGNSLSPPLDAFSWYLDLHTGAVEAANYAGTLTSENRELWQGTALLLEFYALHFLEDSVAAGHMQMDAHSATNTLLGTVHDAANAQGVLVDAPKEASALCEGAPASLVALNAACTSKRAVRIYGDHYLENQGMRDNGARLTFEWAARLVQLSLQEVWQASRAGSKSSAFASQAFSDSATGTDCREALDSSGQIDPSPAQGNPVPACGLDSYCRMLSWWSDDRLSDERRIKLISQHESRFRAFQNVPVPVALYDQDPRQGACDAPALNDSHVFTDFGGVTASATLGGQHPFRDVSSRTNAFDVDVAIGIAPPPRMFPAQAELFIRRLVSLDMQPNYTALGLRYRQLFGVDFGLFLQGDVAFGAGGDKSVVSWDGGAGYIWRRPHHQIGFSLGVGRDPVSSYHAGPSFIYAVAN